MPATWQFEEREGYLVMVMHGEETCAPEIRSEFQSYVVAIAEQCARTVLVDRRNLTNPPTDPTAAFAVHHVATRLDETQISEYVHRCACLIPPDRLSNTTFPEDVFQNRGLNLRYFDDEQQAVEWLTN